MEALSYTAALKQVRSLNQNPGGTDTADTKYQVSIGGNCNVRFLEPGLRVAFGREGLAATIHECGYDSWIADCYQPQTKTDAWVIWLSSSGLSNGGITRGQMDISAIHDALSAALARGERVVVILPETIDVALDGFSQFAAWNRDLRRVAEEAFPDGVLLIDPDRIALAGESHNWFAPSYWSLAKLPLHPDAATLLAQKAAELVLRSRRPIVKAVIVDLDNTLWGGVIGEDGIEGIRLDPASDGRPYLQLQQILKDISEQGVPLAVVSKNNPADAQAPFEQCDEMILRRDDFAAFHAGWGNKFEAIQTIVENLGIGMDTVCFIDDSPHERDEARAFLPELIVPELPENPESRPAALVTSGLFLKPTVSSEDLARVGFYKDNAKRQQHSEKFTDWNSYLASLEMRVEAQVVSAANLQRVTSLVQKTNQFNLTNRRHDSAQIKALASDPNWFTYCYTLSDRFGAAGIIGVMLAHADKGEVEIDTWLLSCRVINRQAELAMFDHLLQWMTKRDITRLSATYVPTPQNVLIENLLSDLSLKLADSDGDGMRYTGVGIERPEYCATLELTCNRQESSEQDSISVQ